MQRNVYREIGKNFIEVKEPPKTEEMEEFWNKTWSSKKEYNAKADRPEHSKLRLDEFQE